MLNPITMKVTLPEKGPVEVVITGADYIAYETTYDRPITVGLNNYTGSVFLLHHALVRNGLYEGSMDDFAALTPEFSTVPKDDGEAVPPLESNQPTG